MPHGCVESYFASRGEPRFLFVSRRARHTWKQQYLRMSQALVGTSRTRPQTRSMARVHTNCKFEEHSTRRKISAQLLSLCSAVDISFTVHAQQFPTRWRRSRKALPLMPRPRPPLLHLFSRTAQLRPPHSAMWTRMAAARGNWQTLAAMSAALSRAMALW